MSTDAFFFFHMDPDNRRGSPAEQQQQQPAASTSSSSSSSVLSNQRRPFLVDYSPKPARVVPTHHQHPVVTQTATMPTAASSKIERWLAGQTSQYSYSEIAIEHSSFSSDEEESEQDEEEASSESSDDDEEGQIYLRPRRQHSAPSFNSTPESIIVLPAAPRKAWPLTAPKPAMPVVDLSEATAFTTQDKSHWSDDEEEEEVEEVEYAESEWDLPALDADDEAAPASTSTTRSIPIPIYAAPRSGSAQFSDAELADEWEQSPARRHHRRRASKVQDGQSFYTPWISAYMAAQNN